MTICTSPFAARIAGMMLCALAAGAVPAARDYEFRHENVLGTSMELCIRAETEDAARSAEARALNRDRPPRGRLQRLRRGERVSPLA